MSTCGATISQRVKQGNPQRLLRVTKNGEEVGNTVSNNSEDDTSIGTFLSGVVLEQRLDYREVECSEGLV